MNLTLATPEDFNSIKDMVVEFANKYPFSVNISDTKINSLIHDFVYADTREKILILANDPEPIGLIAGLKTEILFSDDKLASELMWWVNPSHRTTKAGSELLEAFEFWAVKVGCSAIQMSTVQTEHAERLDKVYNRKGYTLVERGYLKEIK